MSFDQYFFTKPGFWRGFARAIDITGTLSREAVVMSPAPREADARALRSDWVVVGDELESAIEIFEADVPAR